MLLSSITKRARVMGEVHHSYFPYLDGEQRSLHLRSGWSSKFMVCRIEEFVPETLDAGSAIQDRRRGAVFMPVDCDETPFCRSCHFPFCQSRLSGTGRRKQVTMPQNGDVWNFKSGDGDHFVAWRSPAMVDLFGQHVSSFSTCISHHFGRDVCRSFTSQFCQHKTRSRLLVLS